MREERTEVLVVGAGPVGLWSALLLAEAGVEVAIIDREQRTAARSYACALHPQTLRLFERLDLAAPLIEKGRRVPTIAFYDHESRRAEVSLAKTDKDFPFLLLLPQNAVESMLEERLKKAGVNVQWNHRLDDIQSETEGVTATVEELEGTSTGYIVPHWETVVKRRGPVRAEFLVGADGHHSTVHHRLGIESQHVAGPFFFAAFEFESESQPENELRVVLDETPTNVLWPLPGNRQRWTFQLTHPRPSTESPEKERRAVRLSQPAVDEKVRDYVQRIAKKRAPWFSAEVKSIAWCTEVVFEHRVAKQFGKDQCWLVGDAAHQTGPVGVRSMNVGLLEAEALANELRKALRGGKGSDLDSSYNRTRQTEWKRLLGLEGGLKARKDTDPWIGERAARILPCLTGSGADLASLAEQLCLDYP